MDLISIKAVKIEANREHNIAITTQMGAPNKRIFESSGQYQGIPNPTSRTYNRI